MRRGHWLALLIVLPLMSMTGLPAVHAASRPPELVPPGWPKLLIIPRIHISAPVEDLALTRPQDLKAPYKWEDVAWYNRGPRPGDAGRASMFGHLDSLCCPAAFYQLRQLKSGDQVKVGYRNGKQLPFRVMWQQNYPNAKLPMNFIFASVHEHGLVLITCSGAFHRDGTGYDHKLMVYARLILPSGQLG